MRRRTVTLVLTAALLSSACDALLGPRGYPELTGRLQIRGEADLVLDDGGTIACTLGLVVTLTGPAEEEDGVRTYPARYGGDATRTVLDSTGAGFALWPHIHAPDMVVRQIGPDSIEIASPVESVGTSRFWDELDLIAGSATGDNTAEGVWRCAPFDTTAEGYVDTVGTAVGRWIMGPEGEVSL